MANRQKVRFVNPPSVPRQAAVSSEFPSAPFLVEYLDLNNADKFAISEDNSLAGSSSQRLANLF